jgi:cellulose synthase/poly-beta-1,6-N-acetylglucosamine synthase-like glycosyltransferase
MIGEFANFSKFRKVNNVSNSVSLSTPVTVIVPARNEEGRIGRAIKSVLESDYPKKLIQLIIVNDNSDDLTQDEIEQVIKHHQDNAVKSKTVKIHVIRITDDNEKSLPGKPGALQAAIEVAEGELIIMTDADCTVPKNWISSKVSIYSRGKREYQDSTLPEVLIASFTLIENNIKGSGVFAKFQAVEWIYTHTMAAASNTLGIPLGCYGNNLSASKGLFERTDGFKGFGFSVTEDLALMRESNRIKAEIYYPCELQSSVRTLPCNSVKEYLAQHQRWVKGGSALGWIAVAFVVTTVSIILGIVGALIIGEPLLAASYLGFRIVCDTLIIWLAAVKLKEYNLIPWTPFSVLILIIMETILPLLLLKKQTVWKGRIYN